jgi:hypothetical protein
MTNLEANSITNINAKSNAYYNESLYKIYEDIYETNSRQIKLPSGKQKKIDSENMRIPLFADHNMLLIYNYTVPQLKTIMIKYGLKPGTKKPQMLTNLFGFLFLSLHIVKIQKRIRGIFTRQYLKSRGPAIRKREICTNVSDFLTMDNLADLSCDQFFSFEDADGFIYGFDLLSIYNLICKREEGIIQNPYNRLPISDEIINNFKKLIRLSKILKIPICIELKNVNDDITHTKAIELRALSLFQNIDSLGNYSNSKWLMDLSKYQIVRVLKELYDIWSYRAPLSLETKRQICPPTGNPFYRIYSLNQLLQIESIDEVRKFALEILEKFVNSGMDKDSKCLGTYYVLGALTIVNAEAAAALPWLYQAFSYM